MTPFLSVPRVERSYEISSTITDIIYFSTVDRRPRLEHNAHDYDRRERGRNFNPFVAT